MIHLGISGKKKRAFGHLCVSTKVFSNDDVVQGNVFDHSPNLVLQSGIGWAVAEGEEKIVFLDPLINNFKMDQGGIRVCVNYFGSKVQYC